MVSHGGTIQAIARYVLGVPLAIRWRIRLENGGLTIIRHSARSPDPWWMVTLNEVAHLP
jgi:broad specificity phosphatase PhoE